MTKYTIEYSYTGCRGTVYFSVFKHCDVNRRIAQKMFTGFNDGNLTAEQARQFIDEVIKGERTYVLQPIKYRSMAMTAYKLFRLKKNGQITSLFIDNKTVIPLNQWRRARGHRTEGFKYRPGWHAAKSVDGAPHLTNKGRIWGEIEMREFKVLDKPKSQGGEWYLAKSMRVKRLIYG